MVCQVRRRRPGAPLRTHPRRQLHGHQAPPRPHVRNRRVDDQRQDARGDPQNLQHCQRLHTRRRGPGSRGKQVVRRGLNSSSFLVPRPVSPRPAPAAGDPTRGRPRRRDDADADDAEDYLAPSRPVPASSPIPSSSEQQPPGISSPPLSSPTSASERRPWCCLSSKKCAPPRHLALLLLLPRKKNRRWSLGGVDPSAGVLHTYSTNYKN
mmetsp:Transcript_8510/g.21864  ORF Transcript_8510/g.21864 Transcript_8510/m.21864 type:complete len:209 (-) Transcript_8510:15-641(-)